MVRTGSSARALWHPVTGAVLVAAVALALLPAIGLTLGGGALSSTSAGLAAFLALGAVAGFAVSGST